MSYKSFSRVPMGCESSPEADPGFPMLREAQTVSDWIFWQNTWKWKKKKTSAEEECNELFFVDPSLQCFSKKLMRRRILSVASLIPLFWTSGEVCPGVQSQAGSFAWMFSCLCTTDSSDTPLVRHLLTVLRSYLQTLHQPLQIKVYHNNGLSLTNFTVKY